MFAERFICICYIAKGEKVVAKDRCSFGDSRDGRRRVRSCGLKYIFYGSDVADGVEGTDAV